MNADGTGARQLTSNSIPEIGADISPDGSQVLFLADGNESFEFYYNRNLFLVPASGGAGPSPAGGPEPPIDLNTATATDLEELPGVGPATAQAIIEHREQHGPFPSVESLLDVRGIGDAKLAELRDRVVV